MANKWLKQLRAYDDAVNPDFDPYSPENCLYTPSPYFNWIFANKSHGMPSISSVLFFSGEKSGKSLSIYAIIAEMQKRDPEGMAIIFNSELRGQLQSKVFSSIDQDRMTIYDTCDAVEIFDRVENDIKPMVQDGMPLRILVLDSLTRIEGIKRMGSSSVADHLIGDHTLTVQTGLSKLIPFCKRNKILLLATSQIRSNIDAINKYAPKEKMAESHGVKHTFEYFISLKRATAAEDKSDIEGKAFEADIKDARDNKLITGHKIYVKMEQSSLGPQGRAGIFTIDYKQGIINQHEEIFQLGRDTKVLSTTNNRTYEFQGQKFNGKKECALAIRDNPELAMAILEEVRKLDE